jgi:hypothetical protein
VACQGKATTAPRPNDAHAVASAKKKYKPQLWTTYSCFLLVVLAVGCNGFFVSPVLTTMAVGPQATIQQGSTVQMSAVGTYNDGSSSQITSSIYWNSSAPDVATVNGSGLVTGVLPGNTTITGASSTVTGSTTITVVLTGLTDITISPATLTVTGGTPVTYSATGTAGGQQLDITSSVTWTSSDPTVVTFVGHIATTKTVQVPTLVTIIASSNNIQDTATLLVNP